MNLSAYKKTSIKFSNEQYSREIRHAEALKARESSRFERLSLLRDINDSDLNIEISEMEPVNPDEKKQIIKPTVSRLEMLRKWKQEKLLKKELESKYKKKPFYTGGNSNQPSSQFNKTSQNMPSFMDKTNANFNVSKVVKSKLLAPKPPFHPSKPSNFSKQTNSAQKSLGFSNKGNNTATKDLPKAITKSYGNSVKTVNKQCSIPKAMSKNEKTTVVKHTLIPIGMKFTKTSGTCPKTVNGASTIQKAANKSDKVPPVKIPLNEKTNVNPVKTINQESSLPTLTKFSNKSAQKGSFLPKITPAKTSIKSTPKIPFTTTNQKSIKTPILQKETSSSTRNMAKKGYCFKAATGVQKNKTECKNSLKKEFEKGVKSKNKIILPSEDSLFDIPGADLNCDVSIIKPSNSFAPIDFEFKPPAGLSFAFSNEEEDPYEVLENIKLKFMSRTSTPTKADKSDKDSDIKEIKDNLKEQDSIKEKNSEGEIKKEISVSDSLKMMKLDNNKAELVNTHENVFNEVNDNEQKNVKEDINKENDESDIFKMMKLDKNKTELVSAYEEKNIKEEINKENCEHSILQMMKLDNNKAEFVNTFEELSACESPLDIIDVNNFKEFDRELELMNMEEGKVNIIDDIIEKPESVKPERKSASIIPKRVSMLKNMSTLNSIAEADDFLAECLVDIPKNYVNNIPPHHSKRRSVSSHQHLDFLTESIQEENQCLPVTPRRSLRLQKLKSENLEHVTTLPFEQNKDFLTESIQEENQCLPMTPRRSLRLQKLKREDLEHVTTMPFEQNKATPKIGPRRSMRLINLNTPETDANNHCLKSNLTLEFGKLNLLDSENTDPNAFLNDFENSPSSATGFKPRKVSLLYTPEKKSKTMRKSIRGDLMSFSPSK